MFPNSVKHPQRIPAHEARLIAFDIKRMRIEAKTDKILAELLDGLDSLDLEAVAFDRLCQSKTLVNLHRHENHLSRRLKSLQPQLDQLLEIQRRRRQVELLHANKAGAAFRNSSTASTTRSPRATCPAATSVGKRFDNAHPTSLFEI